MKEYKNTMEPLLLTAQIRQIESQAQKGLNDPSLMEKAGMAIAKHGSQMASGKTGLILIIAGPGNNGGDALFAALHLRAIWHNVQVVIFKESTKKPSSGWIQAHDRWLEDGGKFANRISPTLQPDLIIDGLFGIGLNKPLSKTYEDFIHKINALKSNVLSIDIPSGLHADTGAVMGTAIKATETVTFFGAKPGLYTNFGPDYAGLISVVNLSDQNIKDKLKCGRLYNNNYVIRHCIPRRLQNSHKGQYGVVKIFGGAQGMTGAAILAGRASLRLGTGKVHIGVLGDTNSPDWNQPDLMIDSVQSIKRKIEPTDIILTGPGLGNSREAITILRVCIKSSCKLVLDADALNLIAEDKSLARLIRGRKNTTILTPHPKEAGRLLQKSSAIVQNNRVETAKTISQKFNAICLLKGAGSIISDINGDWYINVSGNPGMATSGMGDVLSGIIGALLSQGATGILATLAGARLHGIAADNLTARGVGPIGLTASETIDESRKVINEIFLS